MNDYDLNHNDHNGYISRNSDSELEQSKWQKVGPRDPSMDKSNNCQQYLFCGLKAPFIEILRIMD